MQSLLSSASSSSRTPCCRQSPSWRKTASGVFVWPSSTRFQSWQRNSVLHTLVVGPRVRVRACVSPDSRMQTTHFAGVAYFDQKLGSMCLGWLQDCVFAIREAAIANICRLIEVFGMEWAQHQLVPQVPPRFPRADRPHLRSKCPD